MQMAEVEAVVGRLYLAVLAAAKENDELKRLLTQVAETSGSEIAEPEA